jgi:DNA-binding NarL/FixJ family response regulator
VTSEAGEKRCAVLLVEDDAYTRAELSRAIAGDARLELVASTATLGEARALLARARFDVLVTDLGLPDGDGVELIRELRARDREALAMVITVLSDERSVLRAIEAGASGYLLKDWEPPRIAEAILELRAGGSPMSPSIARHVLRRVQGRAPDAADPSAPELTAREVEVLTLIAKGFRLPEIAKLLEISAHTVTTHVRRIYRKLEVDSRGAAVYEAVSRGLLRED